MGKSVQWLGEELSELLREELKTGKGNIDDIDKLRKN